MNTPYSGDAAQVSIGTLVLGFVMQARPRGISHVALDLDDRRAARKMLSPNRIQVLP